MLSPAKTSVAKAEQQETQSARAVEIYDFGNRVTADMLSPAKTKKNFQCVNTAVFWLLRRYYLFSKKVNRKMLPGGKAHPAVFRVYGKQSSMAEWRPLAETSNGSVRNTEATIST